MGEDAKEKGTRKVGGAEKRKKEGRGLPPLSPVASRFIFVFALSKFSGSDYLGAWNRLCKHDLSSNQHTENVMKYKKTKEKSQSQSQSQSSVPKQFKTNEFQNGTFLRPSSYYKYRGDNLQHSVVNNNETQSRNSRAVALSTHARLRFNSSMSLLL